MSVRTIERHGERVRLATWQGEDGVAHLNPSGGPPLSPRFVATCVEVLTQRGFSSVITGALPPAESAGFLQAGFVVHERLVLLIHDLATVERPGGLPVRRAHRKDRVAVLEVDRRAFEPFWRLDSGGLDEALLATSRRRFRVVRAGAGVRGYAITGKSGPTGYVQRLAVDPDARKAGVGRALVLDGLAWLRRRGARGALVNTQETNAAALALYEAVGFARKDELQVLYRALP